MGVAMQKHSTRDNILDATIDLLWQHSYGTVSVDDICHAAGVQKGSFYHYFPSKADVAIEAFERFGQNTRPLFDSIFSASLPPMQRLKNYCDAAYTKQKELADTYGKVLGCPCMSCGSELSTQDERIRQKMDEMFGRACCYFETLLRDAKALGQTSVASPATGAQEMMSYISGVMYQAKIKNDVSIIRRDLLPGLLRFFNQDAAAKTKKTDRAVKSPDLEKA